MNIACLKTRWNISKHTGDREMNKKERKDMWRTKKEEKNRKTFNTLAFLVCDLIAEEYVKMT